MEMMEIYQQTNTELSYIHLISLHPWTERILKWKFIANSYNSFALNNKKLKSIQV